MRVLLDTNVVLDHLLLREPNIKVSDELFDMIANDKIEAHITTNSLIDIFYLSKKSLGETEAKKAIQNLINVSTIISVDCNDCESALLLPISDFEDAIVVVCAFKTEVDFILTNDKNFPKTKKEKFKTVKPNEFIAIQRNLI